MDTNCFKRTKIACFFSYPSISVVFVLPPVLFYIFRQLYGISYTQVGTLVLINFITQMSIDLIFTFFSRFFNLHKTVRLMPLITAAGLIVYALVPLLFPQHAYLGLLAGTVIFSVSAGLCEVLLSPTIAALPSCNPEKDMSMLHSLYGYGAAGTVLFSTVFLHVFGNESWIYLTLLLVILPVISSILFFLSPLPDIRISHEPAKQGAKKNRIGISLCAVCIFLGGATENIMTNWISVFTESALQVPKMIGDALGLACFMLLLAFTRTLYAKHGKNIFSALLAGMAGALVCYVAAALSTSTVISVLACMLTGICASMLWPGTLILMEEQLPNPGIAAYALMAACGDFGSSLAPQGLGILVDAVAASTWASGLERTLSLSAEQIAMKVGMLAGAIFPILGLALLLYMKKFFSLSLRKNAVRR